MAPKRTSCIAAFLAVICVYFQHGTCINLTINPEVAEEKIDKTLDISCRHQFDSQKVMKPLAMSVFKGVGEHPDLVATLTPTSHIFYGPGVPSRFQVEGTSSKDPPSFDLRVRIDRPQINDSGRFLCEVFYLDPAGLPRNVKTSKNLTISMPGPSPAELNVTCDYSKMYVLESVLTNLVDRAVPLEAKGDSNYWALSVSHQEKVDLEKLLGQIHKLDGFRDWQNMVKRVAALEEELDKYSREADRLGGAETTTVKSTEDFESRGELEKRVSTLEEENDAQNKSIQKLESSDSDILGELASLRQSMDSRLEHVHNLVDTAVNKSARAEDIHDINTEMTGLKQTCLTQEIRIDNIENTVNETSRNTLNFLRNELDNLREVDTEQDVLINDLLQTDARLNASILPLERLTSDMSSKMDTLVKSDDKMLRQLHQLEHVVKRQGKQMEDFTLQDTLTWNKIHLMENTTDRLTQALTDMARAGDVMTAFSTTNDDADIKLTQGDRLVFPDVIASAGLGYNETTGVFTAPTNGVYYFYLYAHVGHSDRGTILQLVVNDTKEVARLFARQKHNRDQSSVSVVVKLDAGDRVSPQVLRAYGSAPYLYKYEASGFGGFLVKAF